MNKPTTHFALATLLIVGLAGCATDTSPSSTTAPMRPVFQSQLPVIEGQVVKNEGNAYVIRELSSGRQTRVAFDRKTVKDNFVIGDTVAARFDGLPSSAYATSITRGTGKPTPPSANTSPRFQTVEGIVQQQDGTDYVIKEFRQGCASPCGQHDQTRSRHPNRRQGGGHYEHDDVRCLDVQYLQTRQS
jgi:hypothetical protein